MKKLIVMLTVTALLSGCGVFNKVFKHKTSEKTLEQNNKSEKSETIKTVTDNSQITITERLDSNIISPEVRGSAKSKINLAAISQGLTIIDDQFINLYQSYNPVDSSLKTEYILKPRLVSVPKERKTQIRMDVKTAEIKQQENKEEYKKQTKKADVLVDRKPDYKVFLIIIITVCLALFIGWLIKTKQYLKFFE